MNERRVLTSLVPYGTLVLVLAVILFSCTGAGSGSDDDEDTIPAVVGAQRDGVDLPDNEYPDLEPGFTYPDTEGIQYWYYYNEAPFTITLDLDGSDVGIEFRSLGLPAHISLDIDTGIISVGFYELEDPGTNDYESYSVDFWSQDGTSDTQSQSLRIDFIVYVN